MRKSFRGILDDGEQQQIHLAGGDSDTGYKLVKFELMPYVFGAGSGELESVVKIYKQKQSAADELIDFSEDDILGAAIINNDSNADSYPTVLTSVFDNEVVNQDLYITHKNNHADAAKVSYYFELEEIKMSKNQQAVVNFEAALLHSE